MKNNEDDLKVIRTVIERTVHERRIIARSDNSVNEIFPVAINSVQGEMLRDRVIREKAKNTIEIGLAWGISTLYILEGLLTDSKQNVRHVALDPFQAKSFKNCGLQLLEDAGVKQFVEHISEESQLALPRFINEGHQFDFAFVDGSHLFDRVFLDLIYLGRLVRPEGVIFADDYQALAVAKAVSFCISNLGWKVEDKGPGSDEHQWIVLRTPRESIPRTYPHFVDF